MEHHQEMASSEALDSMVVSTKAEQEKKRRPPEQSLKCPRCGSTNTKFCYYNNYNHSQPRHLCKHCRRYWTKGGTLRNVPVGGGRRKNSKRSSSSSSSGKRIHDHHQPLITATTTSNPLLPALSDDHSSSINDLTLAFARLQKQVVGGFEFNGLHENISILGSHHHHPSDAYFDSILGSHDFGILNSIRGIYPDTGLENGGSFYYGENDHGREEMGLMGYGDMMTSAATTPTTPSLAAVPSMKQEAYENGVGSHEGEEQNRVFWGFPWQINGGGNVGGGDLDLVRERESSWNIGTGLASSSWHGLLNSPLM
ncbi:hypothetical protein Ancab_008276 [Ancistrocladus abbreviatus]